MIDLEAVADALVAEGDLRRQSEGFGEWGEGLSREERDQWYDAAAFVRALAAP